MKWHPSFGIKLAILLEYASSEKNYFLSGVVYLNIVNISRYANLAIFFLQCGNMAREGFRTLVVAKKVLTEDQYQDFEVCIYDTQRFIFPE